MKILAPAVVLSLALPLFATGAAFADETEGLKAETGKVVIASESGVSTLRSDNVVETASSDQLVKIVKKKSGEITTEVVLDIRQSSTTSAVSATSDAKGMSFDVSALAATTTDARYQEANGDPKKIRELLSGQKRAVIQDATLNVEMLLAQKSDDKVEAKAKAEEKARIEAQQKREEELRQQAERDILEAQLRNEILAESQNSIDGDTETSDSVDVAVESTDANLNTDSFNLQMGDEIEGNNTSRTAAGSTVKDSVKKSDTGTRIAKEALKHLGSSYVWGGESPTDGWDCSGFVQWLYAKEGISIPRVAIDQARYSVKVTNPMPGDLVLQNNGSHIGIYLGGGKMISAWNPDKGTIIHGVDVLPYEFYRVPALVGASDGVTGAAATSSTPVSATGPVAAVATAPRANGAE